MRAKQNKWEHVPERALDDVLEHLNTLNELTPKIRCAGRSIDPALIFGIDSKLFRDPPSERPETTTTATADGGVAQHHDEVETVTLLRGAPAPAPAHVHTDACNHPHPDPPHDYSTAIPRDADAALPPFDKPTLAAALDQLPKECVYRVKGFVRFNGAARPHAAAAAAAAEGEDGIVNWAFGRWELVHIPAPASSSPEENGALVRLTVMGERGEVRRYAKKLAEALGAEVVP